MRTDLEKKVIKLAYENPELRTHLLPLVNKTSSDAVKFILKALEDYAMMFVFSLLRKHTDRTEEYRDLILTIKHDNPLVYQVVKAAWGRRAKSLLAATPETRYMRDFMKAFRSHMGNFLEYAVKKTPADQQEVVEVITGLLDNPRWLLRTIEKGFDKGLQVSI
jgi:hypothetical protein